MTSRAASLLLALVFMGSPPAVAQARTGSHVLLATHGVGDFYPRGPFVVSHVPWSFTWRVNCSATRQKYVLFHVDRWDNPRLGDLVRVEATGQHPTRYTGFNDKTGRLNHWLHAFGDQGMRRELLPVGRYRISIHTPCRWDLQVTSP